MRLGEYPCQIDAELASGAGLWRRVRLMERHRHRFEFNNDYRKACYSPSGVCFSGLSPDGILVEITELQDHPFMLGCQFHPEFLSRPNRPHPLFSALVQAAAEYRDELGRFRQQSALSMDGN